MLHRVTVDLRARTPAGRRLAVFTIVQNEARFLPVWLRHYGRQAHPDDLFVLDHGSTPGSVEAAGARNVVPVHSEVFNQRWLRDQGRAFQRLLLGSYDAVLYTDVDELVAPDPAAAPTLSAYSATSDAPSVSCTGFNVVQHPEEAAFDFGRPVFEQRSWWHPSAYYCKPLLARRPSDWEVGFHADRAGASEPDPSLYLVHLHRVDRDYCRERHRTALARNWSRESLDRNWGWHNRVVDDGFEEWFYAGADLGSTERERIPEHLRGLL